MTSDQKSLYLNGKVLLAMPGMGDPRFHRAVIVMCAHDNNGAMGLVINHPLPGVMMGQLLEQLSIPMEPGAHELRDFPVLAGGPVENVRGFILHSGEFRQRDTVHINDEIGVTGTIEGLRALASGNGPQKMVFALGYSGWSAGQLDQEIQDNAWLVAEPDPTLIFSTPPEDKWDYAIRKMGVDPAMLSGNAGRA